MEKFGDLANKRGQEYDFDYRKDTIRLVGADPMSIKGFTQIPNFILENPKLSVGAKMTYGLLLRYSWEKNSCFPGQKTLAEKAGMGERSVSRHIKELQDKNFISIQRQGLGRPNIYSLHILVEKKKK